MATICKVCEWVSWRGAGAGLFRGSHADQCDGFIHFSTAAQLVETAVKHFAGAAGLVLLAVDADALGSALRWEPSRGGELFPYLYAALSMTAMRRARPLAVGGDGRHIIPELVP